MSCASIYLPSSAPRASAAAAGAQSGKTALMFAASGGHPEVAQVLLAAGATFTTEDNVSGGECSA